MENVKDFYEIKKTENFYEFAIKDLKDYEGDKLELYKNIRKETEEYANKNFSADSDEIYENSFATTKDAIFVAEKLSSDEFPGEGLTSREGLKLEKWPDDDSLFISELGNGITENKISNGIKILGELSKMTDNNICFSAGNHDYSYTEFNSSNINNENSVMITNVNLEDLKELKQISDYQNIDIVGCSKNNFYNFDTSEKFNSYFDDSCIYYLIKDNALTVAVNNQNFEKISKDEKILNTVKEVFGDNVQINEYKFSDDFLSKNGIERQINSKNNFKLEKMNTAKEHSNENNY